MALLHTQAHPFYCPPHAPFLFHSHTHQPKAPLDPLPVSPATLPPPPPPPPPPSSITTKMAHAPPFIPQQHCSQAPDALRLPPLLPVPSASTSMVHASFFFSSCPPPPVPPVPNAIHHSFFFYPLVAPAFSPALSSSPPIHPPPTPFYYASTATSVYCGEGARKGGPSTQLGDGKNPANDVGPGCSGRGARRSCKAGVAPLPGWRGRQRSGCWSWVTKGEAERRQPHLGSLNVRRFSATSSSTPSSSGSPSASNFSASASASADSPAPSPSVRLEFNRALGGLGSRTTVMIRNIPNKYSREMLVKLLDDHCVEVNKKVELESALRPNASPASEYDFVYLPVDFRTNCCMGYAFVNFTTPVAAWRFYQALNNRKWHVFGSKKIIHICYARIQGKEAMLANFGASSFRCDSDGYLPVTFSPPRSGAAPCPPPTLVGKRWPCSTNMPTATAASSSGWSTGYL